MDVSWQISIRLGNRAIAVLHYQQVVCLREGKITLFLTIL